jgi:hypothetical protein
MLLAGRKRLSFVNFVVAAVIAAATLPAHAGQTLTCENAFKPAPTRAQALVGITASAAKKAGGVVLQASENSLRFLMPWPTGFFDPAARIYAKQNGNADYQLTSSEKNYLSLRPGSLTLFEKRKEFLKKHPWWSFVSKSTRTLRLFLSSAALMVAAEQTSEMSANTVVFSEFQKQSENPSELEKVQFLVETVPFPHTAIRIGRRVYSFGRQYNSSISLYEYLNANQEGKTKGLKRSVRVIDLHLTATERAQLRRDLEMSTGKDYLNITGVNDCSSMIVRALERNTNIRVPKLIDPYPTTTVTYLGLRRLLGDTRIGKSSVLIPEGENSQLYAVRNGWISLIDMKAAMLGTVSTYPARVFFDMKFDESQIEYYLPEVEAEIRGWKTEVNQALNAELREMGADKFEIATLDSQTAASLIRFVLDPEIEQSRAVISDEASEFKDVVLAEYKLSLLLERRKLLEARTN